MNNDAQLAALTAIWQGIEAADHGVIAYLNAGGDSRIAVEAMSHPMKGLQGRVEGRIFDISPDAMERLSDAAPLADPGAAIMAAYATYDSDPRVNGPDGFEAFRDAVAPLWQGKGEQT